MKKMKLKNGNKKYRIKRNDVMFDKDVNRILKKLSKVSRETFYQVSPNISKQRLDEAFDKMIKQSMKDVTETITKRDKVIEDKEERTKLFFDTEFTGLHKDTSLISIGIVSEYGDKFYAEFSDYKKEQADSWIKENIISNLKYNSSDRFLSISCLDKKYIYYVKGSVDEIKHQLINWILNIYRNHDFKKLEFWSDCLSWDWVLFVDIFGSSFDLPFYIYPYPMDIVTMFRERNIDPDVNREYFVYKEDKNGKHNALFDAEVIRDCYYLLKSMEV